MIKPRPGYYTLTHRPTGLYYIGSSVNISERMKVHRYDLRKGIHKNPKLLAAYTCWEDYDVYVVYTDGVDQARRREQELIDVHHGRSRCCNVGRSTTDPTLGVISTERRREVMRGNTINNGRVQSVETRAKIGAASVGRTKSPEVRAKIAAAKEKAVSIDGTVYTSLTEAGQVLGLNYKQMVYRVTVAGGKYQNWKYAE